MSKRMAAAQVFTCWDVKDSFLPHHLTVSTLHLLRFTSVTLFMLFREMTTTSSTTEAYQRVICIKPHSGAKKNQLQPCDALVRRHDIFSDVHNIQIYCWKILLYHSLILWRLTASLTMTSTTMMSTTMLTGVSCVWHIWWWWTNSILVVEIWKKFMLNNKSSSSTDILWWWWFWFFLAAV